jgi:hypothetical protein
MNNTEKTLDKVKVLCDGRGFVYPGSEIYGGLITPIITAIFARLYYVL